MAKFKEFKAPSSKPVKVFTPDGFHSALVEDTWTMLRDELWKAAYSEGCISKDMAVKGFDKDQTLAAIKQEEMNYNDQVKAAMLEIIELGDPDTMDAQGRPRPNFIGERTGKIPSATLRNKLFKELVQ